MGLNPQFEQEGATKPDSLAVDSYEHALSASRVLKIPSNQQTLIDYVGGTNAIYVGTAASGVATSFGTDNDSTKPNWLIQKITYDGNNNPTAIKIGWGKWDSRASLTYA